MVMVDGLAQTSCNLPLWAVADKSLTTVEGLQVDGHPSCLQRAFIEERAGQCGYCLPGILMAASALIRNPRGAEQCRGLRGAAREPVSL